MDIPARILLPAVLALAATACAQTFQAGAALVNGTRIAEEDLDAAIVAQQGGVPEPTDETQELQQARAALSVLIQQELIRQEADLRGFAISEDRVDQEIAGLQGPVSDEEFAERVAQAGLTMDSLREQIQLRAAVDAIRADLAPEIDGADLRDFYDQTREQYRQAKIKHILFLAEDEAGEQRAERRARATLVEIQAGEDFDRLARRRSQDPGSADNGGRLPGWTALSQLDPTFAQAAQDATIGEVTEPVRTQFGWHLILVLDRRVQPFDGVAPQIRAQLEQQAGDSAFQDFLVELTQTADIEVNPRYGDWDPETASIVPHRFFTPAEPETDPLAPPVPQ